MTKRRTLPLDEKEWWASGPHTYRDLCKWHIAKEQHVLAGKHPARTLKPEPPGGFENVLKEWPMVDPGWVAHLRLLTTYPFRGNPLQNVAVAAQRTLRQRRAAQWQKHERERSRGVPSPNQVHRAIEHAIAETGSRRGAVTYAAQCLNISERQVHRLEQVWRKASENIARWRAELDSLKP